MGSKNYRIAGLGVVGHKTATSESQNVGPVMDMTPRDNINLITKVLGPVYLSDGLYDVDVLNLQNYWPTFDFLKRRISRGPLKVQPVALAGWYDECSLEAEETLSYLSDFLTEQNYEINGLKFLLETMQIGELPRTDSIEGPVTAAFAAYLFRGSNWFRENQTFLFELIKTCPWGSYMAFCSGQWTAQRITLLKKISENPRLAVDLFTKAGTHELIDIDLLPTLIAGRPHLEVLIAGSMQGSDDICEEFWTRFQASADTTPMAAAFCLAIMPGHSKAPAWEKVIKNDPHAIYWCFLAFKESGQIKNYSFFSTLGKRLLAFPQWDYHFVMNLESDYAITRARRLWPHPWAIEMIHDLKIPYERFSDLYERTMAGDSVSKAFKDALTLWTAHHCQPPLKMDFEDFEDENDD